MSTLLALVVVTAAVAAEPESTTTPKPLSGDLVNLQGAWTAKAGPKGAWPVRLEVEGCRVRLHVVLPLGQEIRAEGELAVDESTTPRSLDWRNFHAPDGSPVPTIEGIYRLEAGTFIVCNAGFHDARPTEFEPGDGVLADIVTFERPTSSTSDEPPAGQVAVVNVVRPD